MSIAKKFGAVAIEGLHNEAQRFPYARFAETLPTDKRDKFAYSSLRRTPIWGSQS